MAITFQCDNCGKEIKAKDSAGGKWGKCPSCKHKLYVPDVANNEEEELTFAPVDEDAQRREKELMAETLRLQQDILKEKGDASGQSSNTASFEISEKDLMKNIILYLRQMANDQHDDAEITVKGIVPYSRQAIGIIDRIALSDMPEPELADIEPQALSGYIRTLRGLIS